MHFPGNYSGCCGSVVSQQTILVVSHRLAPGGPSAAGRGWRCWRHRGDLQEGAAFWPQSIKKKEFPGRGGSDAFQEPPAAGRGHPRGGRDVPVGSQAQGLRLRSVIPWVSMVGTGCPVRSSSRSPFGAQSSSFGLSSLPLPLCHQLFPQIRPRLHPLLAVLHTKSALLGDGEKHFWKGIFFLLWGCAPGLQQNLARPIRGAAPAADGQPAPCGGQARLATIPEAK